MQPADVEEEVLGLERSSNVSDAGVQLVAQRARAAARDGSTSGAGRGRAGQQDAGLLEGLAHRGDPVAEAARRRARGWALASASSRSGQRARTARRAVTGVDRAAGEHVRTADPLRVQVPPEHEDLEVGVVAHQHHGGGFARCHHRPRRSARATPRIRAVDHDGVYRRPEAPLLGGTRSDASGQPARAASSSRRSCSLSPPQMPWGSRISSA